MGLFDKWFGRDDAERLVPTEEAENDPGMTAPDTGAQAIPSDTSDIIESMLERAKDAVTRRDFEMAVKSYQTILKLTPNATAQFNLGGLYALGKGVNQDFVEGGYWFRQAELSGDESAGAMYLRCESDLAHRNLSQKTPGMLYAELRRFYKRVFPEVTDENQEIGKDLYVMGEHHLKKGEFGAAAAFFRAGAQFASDARCQNYTGALYNAGLGVGRNDLAALYWFDKAVDNGAGEAARTDRDGILQGFRANLPQMAFSEQMCILSDWCATGTRDVPQDLEKAGLWRHVGEGAATPEPRDS